MRQFAKAGASPNTFIGGIAKTGGTGINAPIDTPYKLSQKLGIAVNRITGFRVNGDDVACRIRGNYETPFAAFGNTGTGNSNLNITSYNDAEGLVDNLGNFTFYGTTINSCNFPNATDIGNRVFDNCAQFREGLFPNVVTLTGQRHFTSCIRLNNLYLPNLEEVVHSTAQEVRSFSQIGANAASTLSVLDVRKLKKVGNNSGFNWGTFYLIKSGITIRVHEDMAVNNPLDLNIAKTTQSCTVELYDDNGDFVSNY